jgi:hypothetical protein
MLKGVLHVHSTYSDGEFTLEELRDIFSRDGCRFVCVTDHADAFDADKLEAYRRECETRSDARFRFVAGLEFGCVNRMHILGYGVTALIQSTDPQEVIARIRSIDGVAVIAHPRDQAFGAIEAFEVLPHGIETWNTKYDGRYAPRPRTFALLGRLQRRQAVTAFYGQDLHWRRQYRGMFTRVAADRLDAPAILQALKSGRYVGVKDGLELPSSGELPAAVLADFARANARSRQLRQWVASAKSYADRMGLAVPASLKAHLRSFF